MVVTGPGLLGSGGEGAEFQVAQPSRTRSRVKFPSSLGPAYSSALMPSHWVTASQPHFLLYIDMSVIKGRENRLVAYPFWHAYLHARKGQAR